MMGGRGSLLVMGAVVAIAGSAIAKHVPEGEAEAFVGPVQAGVRMWASCPGNCIYTAIGWGGGPVAGTVTTYVGGSEPVTCTFGHLQSCLTDSTSYNSGLPRGTCQFAQTRTVSVITVVATAASSSCP